MPHSLKPRALEDLGRIYAEGLQRWGERQAEAYLDGMRQTFELLVDHPHIARLRSELATPLRVHRYRSHLIFYDLGVDDRVVILRVRHAREDWVSDPL